jgi:hypothetical protein
MTNPVDRTTYRAAPHYARAASVDKRPPLFHNGPVGKGRFFMQFVNSSPDILRSIDQCRSLSHWDRLGPPMPQGFQAEGLGSMAENVSFQDASEGNIHILTAPATALCTTIQH